MSARAGTWTLDPCESADGYYTVRVDDGTEHGDTQEHPIATAYHEANARLIASAPDLADALRDLADITEAGDDGTPEYDIVRAAACERARAALKRAGGIP